MLMSFILLISGCGANEVGESSSLRLDKDGVIKSVMTADFDKDYYSITELRTNIEEAVAHYNNEHDGFRIQLLNLKQDKGRAQAELYYRTAEDYRAFNNVNFFVGTPDEALQTSLLTADALFQATADGEASVSLPTIKETHKKAKVLIFQEPMAVTVPGKILYTLGDVTLNEETTVTAVRDSNSDILSKAVIIIYE